MKRVSIYLLMVLLAVGPWAMAGQVYEWIDEKGVKHFTNEPPPPEATIVKQDREIPYDAEQDRQRKESDKKFLEQKQQQQAGTAETPKPVDTAPPDQEKAGVSTRDGNTYHQRQVQKEQRVKQEIREHGGRPEAKPAPANRSEAKPAPARQSGAD